MRYAGWVHIRGEMEGNWCSEHHFDTTSGTSVMLWRVPEGLTVKMYIPAERKEVVYHETDAVVRVADLHDESATQLVALAGRHELTVEDLVSGRPGATAVRTGGGELDRYQISIPAEDKATCTDGRCSRPAAEGVVWADSSTGLVRRADLLVGGKRMTSEYTYGEPAIRDVYDVGVPRGARVVDSRADAATREVVERLTGRYQTGFGDYVAVATRTPVGEDGRAAGEWGAVHLYARSREAFLANQYVVGSGGTCCGGTSCEPRPERPAGWPTPELRTVLNLLHGRVPSGAFVGNGKRAWLGGNNHFQEMRLEQVFPSQMAADTLPGKVWPTREGLSAYGTNVTLEVVWDRGRPGLVGLRMDRYAPNRAEDVNDRRRMQHDVMTFWLDPLRDDVPVEATSQSYAKGSAELESDGRTTYTAWDRTSDGRWYPSAWRVVTRFNQRGEWTARTEDWRLQVWTGERLGAEWFADPTTNRDAPPTATGR